MMKQLTFNEWKAKEDDKTAKPNRRKKRRPKKRERIRDDVPPEERLVGLNLEYYELVRSF